MNAPPERHLSLLIPGLFAPAPADADDDPAVKVLETLLARADEVEVGPSAYPPDRACDYSVAREFALFGVTADGAADLPVAPVTRLAEGGDSDGGWWLRADPVNLQPRGGGLILRTGMELALTAEQSRALVDELLHVYAADGWTLEARHPYRWYLRLAAVPDMQTSDLAPLIDRDIQAYLPTGRDAKNWHILLNEIQILLHTCAVNVERESGGQLPINSVWFWGGGMLPSLPPAPWSHVWSDRPVSRGLAALARVPLSPPPADAARWLAGAGAGRHLLVLAPFDPLGVVTDASVTGLERQWLNPLVAALKAGALQSLTLYGERGPGFRVTRRALGRWWRRRRPLRHYLQDGGA